MRDYTSEEYFIIARALMILHYILSGDESKLCLKLADEFASFGRISREAAK